MRFVLIDETLVDKGFWVLVSGIILDRFKKNPVMYWMHQRPSRWDSKDEQMLPIGRWEDIKLETIKGNESITATPVFDEKDDFAVKIKNKVDGNFLRMASAGLRPITVSDEKRYLKSGQTRATLVKSEMIEASIVDIGSNANAVRLYADDGKVIDLSSESENTIIPTLNSKTDMKLLALKLGLKEDATEAEILAKIAELQASEKANKELAENLQNERIAELLKSDVITDENKTSIEKLAKTDFNLAKDTVRILEEKAKEKTEETDEPERLSAAIQRKKLPETKDKKWDEFSDDEKLSLRENKPEEYVKLYKAEFGFEPEIV
ncbi:MAG: hypothetical protein L3J56_10820 [Bacteroidales bacterium]|nr:hypothetical protein [Bacteroidales bacterium]